MTTPNGLQRTSKTTAHKVANQMTTQRSDGKLLAANESNLSSPANHVPSPWTSQTTHETDFQSRGSAQATSQRTKALLHAPALTIPLTDHPPRLPHE